MNDLLHRYRWALFSGIVVVYVFLASRYLPYSVDDLYIVLRYVSNAANGHGLVYNIGERVEGYTCFAWVGLITLCAKAGLSAYWSAKLLGMVLAVVTLWLTWRMGTELCRGACDSPSVGLAAAALLAVNPVFVYWSVGGLETMLYATAIAGVLCLLVVERRIAEECGNIGDSFSVGQGVLCALAAMTRPEGLVMVILALVVKSVVWHGSRMRVRVLLVLAVSCAIPLLVHFVWRLNYYGDPLPNTYYAKMGGAMAGRLRHGVLFLLGVLNFNGFGWVGRHGQTAVVGAALFVVLPALAWPFVKERFPYSVLSCCAVLLTGIAIWEGGDWMPRFRFIVPVLPLAATVWVRAVLEIRRLLLERLGGRAAAMAATGFICVIPALGIDHLRMNFTAPVELARPDESWSTVLAEHMLQRKNAQATVALSDIGLVGYLTGYRVVDLAGLTDRHIARAPGGSCQKDFDVSYVLEQKPEFIVIRLRFLPDRRLCESPGVGRDYEFIREEQGRRLYERK